MPRRDLLWLRRRRKHDARHDVRALRAPWRRCLDVDRVRQAYLERTVARVVSNVRAEVTQQRRDRNVCEVERAGFDARHADLHLSTGALDDERAIHIGDGLRDRGEIRRHWCVGAPGDDQCRGVREESTAVEQDADRKEWEYGHRTG